jgi:hypothetical protein
MSNATAKKRLPTIKTVAPKKGDLVVGHRVYAFVARDLPAVPGKVVEVSPSGHMVRVETNETLVLFGLPRFCRYTWRKDAGAYQQINQKTEKGLGLALRVGAP